jgi:hypothetical protein
MQLYNCVRKIKAFRREQRHQDLGNMKVKQARAMVEHTWNMARISAIKGKVTVVVSGDKAELTLI